MVEEEDLEEETEKDLEEETEEDLEMVVASVEEDDFFF